MEKRLEIIEYKKIKDKIFIFADKVEQTYSRQYQNVTDSKEECW